MMRLMTAAAISQMAIEGGGPSSGRKPGEGGISPFSSKLHNGLQSHGFTHTGTKPDGSHVYKGASKNQGRVTTNGNDWEHSTPGGHKTGGSGVQELHQHMGAMQQTGWPK